MPDSTLPPAVALAVDLTAICMRGQYAADPAPVIRELREAAGNDSDVLAEAVGVWVGYNADLETEVLRAALLEAFPDCARWIPVGASCRGKPSTSPAILVDDDLDDLGLQACPSCLEPMEPVVGAWWCAACGVAVRPGE